MDKAELLTAFTERVEQFDRYQSFIAKAQGQSGKFASAVVEKVVADNESKSMEVVAEIIPLMADMESVIDELRQKRAEALDSSKESQFRLEELELRLAIGDLSEEDFNAEASDYKATVENTESKVAELDKERIQFEEALSRWQELGMDAGVLANGAGHAPMEEPEPVIAADPVPQNGMVSHDYVQEEIHAEPEPMYASNSYGGAGVSDAHDYVEYEAASHEPEVDMVIDNSVEPIETFDVGDDAQNFSDYGDEGGNGFEVDELDLVEQDAGIAMDDGGGDKDRPRRAVLLYQEGTAEEQIYPFTGEVMSLGRGRDNDVQVKNDSKVSRYHCKLYRRGPNFYIEDNKSANGTLVNGELITERRLFGGEEVIIGETFFRFRILD